MASLEAWIVDWLARYSAPVKAGYGSGSSEFIDEDELSNTRWEGKQYVAEALLFHLHQTIKGQPAYEEPLWDFVLWRLAQTLPDAIVNDLIDRELSILVLGHISFKYSEAIQHRLIPIISEARDNWTIELYTNPGRTTSEFIAFLKEHPCDSDMLKRLLHLSASSPEKLAVICEAARADPAWPRLKYYVEMADPSEEELARRAAWRAEIEAAKQERIRQLEVAPTTEDIKEIHALYEMDDAEILLRLVRNPHLPDYILEELRHFHGQKGAKMVRRAARKRLDQRGNL